MNRHLLEIISRILLVLGICLFLTIICIAVFGFVKSLTHLKSIPNTHLLTDGQAQIIFIIFCVMIFVFGIRVLVNGFSKQAIESEVHLPEAEKDYLQEIFADLKNLPSKQEVHETLSQRKTDRLIMANPDLQPIAFAIRINPKIRYVAGVLLEVVTWSFLPFWILGLGALHRYDFVGVTRLAFRTSVKKAIQICRQARRYRINTHNKLRKDSRPFILYLRSFDQDDSKGYTDKYLQKTSEEKMISAYRNIRPFIAVGDPREKYPLLGAYRIYFPDDVWKAGVLYLMSVSFSTVIHAGFSPGTVWELTTAKQILPYHKVQISFYSWADLSPAERDDYYRRFKRLAEKVLQIELPESIEEDTLYIYFNSGWESQLYPNKNIPVQTNPVTERNIQIK